MSKANGMNTEKVMKDMFGTDKSEPDYNTMPKVGAAYLQSPVTWADASGNGQILSQASVIATVGAKKIPGLTAYMSPCGSIELFKDGQRARIAASNIKIASLIKPE